MARSDFLPVTITPFVTDKTSESTLERLHNPITRVDWGLRGGGEGGLQFAGNAGVNFVRKDRERVTFHSR